MEETEDTTAEDLLMHISQIANNDDKKASKKIKEIRRSLNEYIESAYILSSPANK